MTSHVDTGARPTFCELCNAEGPTTDTRYGAACRPCAAEVARAARGYNPTTGWTA